MMEKTVGIHRDRVRPTHYRETVDRWFRKRRSTATGANGSSVLFCTCTVHYSDPLVGRAALEVIERSDVEVDLCYQRCCGMLDTDTGNLGAARRGDERSLADLLPLIESGAEVVIPGPSCSLWIEEEYRDSWAATPRTR